MQWLDTCIPEPNVTQYTDWLVCHHVSIRLIEGTRWRIILVCRQHFTVWSVEAIFYISRVSCQKGPTRHANAWQKGPFWQDTLDMFYTFECCQNILGDTLLLTRLAVDYWLLLLYVNAPCYYQHQPVKKFTISTLPHAMIVHAVLLLYRFTFHFIPEQTIPHSLNGGCFKGH